MNAWFHELNIWRGRATVIITLSTSTIHFHIYLRVHSIIFLFDPLGMHYSHENLTAHSPHMLNHEKKRKKIIGKCTDFHFYLMRSPIAVHINYKYPSADHKERWHDILHSALNAKCKNARNQKRD